MKIGFDAKRAVRNFTGLGNYSRFVINNLIRLYPENEYTLFSPQAINLKKTELRLDTNTKIITKQGFSPLWRSLGITKELKKTDLDIYHGLSHELPYGIDKLGLKSVVTMHDVIFLKFPYLYPVIDRTIYHLKAKYACEKADKIIAISECTKRDIISYYHTDPDKIEVVYQGCFPIFKQQVSDDIKKQVCQKYNLPKQFLLSVGSIEKRKNILLILKAMTLLPDDTYFVAIGKQTKYIDELRSYITEHHLEKRVTFLTGVPLVDLPAILQSSNLFIYPSRYEGFGIPILEAISSGVPVIAATGSCLEEAGGKHSLYVDPDNDADLAEKIQKIRSDQELRRTMIEEGLIYSKKFSDEQCSADLMKVYQSLLQ